MVDNIVNYRVETIVTKNRIPVCPECRVDMPQFTWGPFIGHRCPNCERTITLQNMVYGKKVNARPVHEKRINPTCFKCKNFDDKNENSIACYSKTCPSTNRVLKIDGIGWEKDREPNWTPSKELVDISSKELRGASVEQEDKAKVQS